MYITVYCITVSITLVIHKYIIILRFELYKLIFHIQKKVVDRPSSKYLVNKYLHNFEYLIILSEFELWNLGN